MWAIVKKEVKSYFLSPIGYVFIGLFLAMCSVFFYLDIVQYGSLQFENMFYSASTILTFIIPILTMRMFADLARSDPRHCELTNNLPFKTVEQKRHWELHPPHK